MYITVSIFMIDRAYGGPEEGGWWYNYGEPAEGCAEYIRRFPKRQRFEAEEYAESLRNDVLPVLNRGRRPIYSVTSSGMYSVVVSRGEPQAYPAQTPHYE